MRMSAQITNSGECFWHILSVIGFSSSIITRAVYKASDDSCPITVLTCWPIFVLWDSYSPFLSMFHHSFSDFDVTHLYFLDLPAFHISLSLLLTMLMSIQQPIQAKEHFLLTISWRRLKKSTYTYLIKMYHQRAFIYRSWDTAETILHHWDWRGRHLRTASCRGCPGTWRRTLCLLQSGLKSLQKNLVKTKSVSKSNVAD